MHTMPFGDGHAFVPVVLSGMSQHRGYARVPANNTFDDWANICEKRVGKGGETVATDHGMLKSDLCKTDVLSVCVCT